MIALVSGQRMQNIIDLRTLLETGYQKQEKIKSCYAT